MQETQRAKTAYAEYLAMGPGRSLEKLLAEYQERKRTGKGASVPTTRYATLADWSRKHGWQARVAAFEGKQNEALVARSMDDIEKARQDSLRLVQAAKFRVAQAIMPLPRNGVLALEALQWHAKKPLDWKSFMNGSRNFTGTVLGTVGESKKKTTVRNQ